MSKKIIIIGLIVLTAVLGLETIILFRKQSALKKELQDIKNNIESLAKENDELQSRINYFSKPENLEKELRSKFNYKLPDEKMMIITP